MSDEDPRPEHHEPWTGRDGALGLGPNAPAPAWQPAPPAPGQPGPPPWAYYGYAPAGPSRQSIGWKITAGVAVLAAACAAGFGIGVWRAPDRTVRAAAPRAGVGSSGRRSTGGSTTDPFGALQLPTFGLGGGAVSHAGSASVVQSSGIVDIDTQLGYQGEEGAGTGMIMSSDGYVLTNNHVVDGATSIDATDVATGATYTATVVGTDPTQDVAVIKLSRASGLSTARFGTSITVGAKVTGVGNAGGVGGTPSAASGTVVALNQKLTASDDGSNAEKLTGMIATNADIIPGDSGGPLYDASQHIVGMDTAASSSTGTAHRGYAIPITTARSIAARIESGVRTSSIHQGYPGFLGIEIATTQAAHGVPVASVLEGGPAQSSGLVAGDDITAIDGSPVSTVTGLHESIEHYRPGARVTVSYLSTSGRNATATVTLAIGPAD